MAGAGPVPATSNLYEANWVVRSYCRIPGSIWRNGILYASCVFVSTFLLAAALGLSKLLVTSPFVYCVLFAIAWTACWARWGFERLSDHIAVTCSCFLNTTEQVFCPYWRRRFSSTAGTVAFALLWWVLGAVTVVRALLINHAPLKVGNTAWMIPGGWFDPAGIQKVIIFCWIGLGAALVAGVATHLFVTNLLFLRAIDKLTPLPLASALLIRFRSMSAFYGTAALTWFLGIGITAVVGFTHLSFEALVFLAATSTIGMITIVWPHMIFRRMLHAAQLAVADSVTEVLRNYEVPVFDKNRFNTTSLRSHGEKINALVALAQPTSVWVYSVRDIAFFLVGTFWSPIVLWMKPHIDKVLFP